MFFMAMAISFAATFVGTVTGGSTSVISLPCWLSFGFPLATAVATEKTAAAIWTAVASRNYLRGKTLDYPLLSGLAGFGILGAVFGSTVTMTADPAIVKRVVGSIVLSLV